MPNSNDDNYILECYNSLLEHIDYEGNLMWARNAAFLTLNTVGLGFILSKEVSSLFIRLFFGVLAIFFNFMWLAVSLRANQYYDHWWRKIVDLESELPKIDTFKTGGLLFPKKKKQLTELSDEKNTITDKHKFKSIIDKVSSTIMKIGVSKVNVYLPLLFLLAWISVIIYFLIRRTPSDTTIICPFLQ
jgi:hypothetical protein